MLDNRYVESLHFAQKAVDDGGVIAVANAEHEQQTYFAPFKLYPHYKYIKVFCTNSTCMDAGYQHTSTIDTFLGLSVELWIWVHCSSAYIFLLSRYTERELANVRLHKHFTQQ